MNEQLIGTANFTERPPRIGQRDKAKSYDHWGEVKQKLWGSYDSTKKLVESQSPDAWEKRILKVIDTKIIPKLSPKSQAWVAAHREEIGEAAGYAGVGITTAEILTAVALGTRVLTILTAPMRERAERRAFYRYLMSPEGTRSMLDAMNPVPPEARDEMLKITEQAVDEKIRIFKQARKDRIASIHRTVAHARKKREIRLTIPAGPERTKALAEVGKKIPETRDVYSWPKQVRLIILGLRKNIDDTDIRRALEKVKTDGPWYPAVSASERDSTVAIQKLLQLGLQTLSEEDYRHFMVREPGIYRPKNAGVMLGAIADRYVRMGAPGLKGLYKLSHAADHIWKKI